MENFIEENQIIFLVKFVENYWVIILFMALWSVPWKGAALWKSARLGDFRWFVALLVINTVGILEILYIFVFSKRSGIHIPKGNKEKES